MFLKLDYDTAKLQTIASFYNIIRLRRTKKHYQHGIQFFFPFSSPSLSKILVALLDVAISIRWEWRYSWLLFIQLHI